MKTFSVPKDYCLCCNKKVDAASTLGGNAPKPGDISVCFYCGMMAQYGPDLRLKKIDNAEMDRLRKSATWKTIVEMQQKLNRFRDNQL